MSLYALLAVLISVTALLAWLNERVLRLPPTIGLMASALCLSLALVLAGRLGWGVQGWAERLFQQVDFSAVLMQGMLSFLLFAGALHVDLNDLIRRRWSILSLATLGVLLSTFLVGTAMHFALRLIGFPLPYLWSLLFGALISPTDPIAVMSTMKKAGAPKDLESMVIGESLFNDGVGVVVFTMVLGFAVGGRHLSAGGAAALFLEEAVGGALFGFVLGYVTYRMLKSVDNYAVEVLLTLALVAGGYALAGALHTSGPIAMVVAGLFIGNHGRLFGMSQRTREHLDTFWELVDEILNAMLFVMIGFELLVLELRPGFLLAGALAVPLVLAARLLSVSLPIALLRAVRSFPPRTVRLMTWAGVRGGISIALALSLPASPERDLILVTTYAVVVFSILVQGLTLGRAVRAAA